MGLCQTAAIKSWDMETAALELEKTKIARGAAPPPSDLEMCYSFRINSLQCSIDIAWCFGFAVVSYSVTLCAERVAASQAILAGEHHWESMVVLSPQRVSMCGTCRQFCHEFSPHVEVWTGFLDRNDDMFGPTPLWQLLPDGMRLEKF